MDGVKTMIFRTADLKDYFPIFTKLSGFPKKFVDWSLGKWVKRGEKSRGQVSGLSLFLIFILSLFLISPEMIFLSCAFLEKLHSPFQEKIHLLFNARGLGA